MEMPPNEPPVLFYYESADSYNNAKAVLRVAVNLLIALSDDSPEVGISALRSLIGLNLHKLKLADNNQAK